MLDRACALATDAPRTRTAPASTTERRNEKGPIFTKGCATERLRGQRACPRRVARTRGDAGVGGGTRERRETNSRRPFSRGLGRASGARSSEDGREARPAHARSRLRRRFRSSGLSGVRPAGGGSARQLAAPALLERSQPREE